VLSLVSALALLAGCQSGGTDNPGGGLGNDNGATGIVYQPNAKVLEEDEGNAAIAGISTNGAALMLDMSNATAAALQPGDILVIKGLLAKRIIAVEPHDPYLLVLTAPATLAETITDGQIAVSTSIKFGDLPAARLVSPDSEAAASAEEAGARDAFGNIVNGLAGALTSGWKTDWSVTPSAGRVDIKLKLTKSAGGLTSIITGDGYLTGFDFTSNILVQQSTYQKIEANLTSLNGVMNFTWEVASDTPGDHTDMSRIKLPGAIEIPLAEFVGGMPLFLEISAALIIEPALTGGQEYSRGSFRITYDGTQHFSAHEGTIDSDGNVTGDVQFLETQNISALAPLGMVVSFAAPRIELTFGVSKALKSSGDIQQAAQKVDQLADLLAKNVLTADQYQQFKDSPAGQFSLSNAAEISLASDAEAFFEMVTSSAMSNTGFSVITPCTRQDITLAGKVGASAEAFGQDLGSATKEIFSQTFTNVDPPGTPLCENIANGGS